MTDDELTALRRANPVADDAVAHLVARQRSALTEAIGEVRDGPGPARHASRASATGRPSAFSLGGIAAAMAVALVLPVLLIATVGRDGGDRPGTPGDLPTVRDLPAPERHDRPEPLPTAPPDDVLVPPSSEAGRFPSTTARPPSEVPVPTTPPVSAASAEQAPTTHVIVQPPPSSTTQQASPSSTLPVTTATTTPTTSTTQPPTTTSTSSTTIASSINHASQPFDPTRDLLVITLDFAHQDDGHAAVAALELTSHFAIDPIVVAGTQGPESTTFIHEYATIMNAAWGSAWLDATNDRAAASAESATRWLETIDAGGVVRVAEGGVSDFTAKVMREVLRRRPGLDTSAVVHVVHHHRRNEDMTRPGDLEDLRPTVRYERIDDGNSLNETAGLTGANDAFETAALSGPHRDAWAAAFGELPADSLDFSDTVTVLHVLAVDSAVVTNPESFAAMFMS